MFSEVIFIVNKIVSHIGEPLKLWIPACPGKRKGGL